MKIWIMSDLHVDAQDRDFDLPAPPPEADLLVVAGDIADGFSQGYAWLVHQREAGIDIPIVWVPGNHDYFRCIDPEAALDAVTRDCRELGVTVLGRGESVVGKGVRFIGATLWTDFAAVSDDPYAVAEAQVWARWSMPDYQNIKMSDRVLAPTDTLAWHRMHRSAIEKTMHWEPFSGPTVVVTHHAPHRLSLDDPAFPDPSDGSFASDLGDVMDRYRPDLWVHGHLHWRRDYTVAGTRVLCNPRGYGRERSGFDPRFVVEVPT